MLVSDSTHIPPTGTNWPAATFAPDPLEQFRVVLLDPGELLGRRAGEDEIRGARPSESSTVENVRAHLRIVSRTGQSHAESMCACPTACSWCALADAGEASTPASSARPAAAVPATSPGSITSSMRSSARRISARRGWSTGSSSIRPSSISMSRSSSQTVTSSSPSSIRPSRYSGAVPAVARSPSGVGEYRSTPSPSIVGLDAASTKQVDGFAGPAASTGPSMFSGAMPLMVLPSAVYARPSAWKPGE